MAQIDKKKAMNMYRKVQDELPKQTKAHLETFNDGVIAIYITIMALELPYPHGDVSIHSFLGTILIFFISFFVIANFWYDIHRTFLTFDTADHGIVVVDFILLAFLALIPVMTKWVMHTSTEASVIGYGILYLLVSLLELLLFYMAHRQRFNEYIHYFRTFLFLRTGSVLLINLVLIGLATQYPKEAMVLYLLLPIISFFFPQFRLKRRVQNHLTKKGR